MCPALSVVNVSRAPSRNNWTTTDGPNTRPNVKDTGVVVVAGGGEVKVAPDSAAGEGPGAMALSIGRVGVTPDLGGAGAGSATEPPGRRGGAVAKPAYI